MNKKYNYLTIAVLGLIVISPLQNVLAQNEGAPTTSREDRIKTMEIKIQTRQNEIENRLNNRLASTTARINDRREKITLSTAEREKRIEEAKARIASSTKARIERQNKKAVEVFKTQSEKITANYIRTINNLKDVIDKIQSRIDKLTVQGLDMTTASTTLATAQSKITDAQKSLTDLQTYISQQTVSAQNRQSILATIKTQGEIVKNKIKDAHGFLIQLLASIKNEAEKNITTSTDTSTSTATSTNTNQ
jgi:peptidoglycan hydrolase CwlO-like protein